MKSHEKVPLMVLVEIYIDYTRMCCVEKDVRDLQKLASRFEHEGLTFLTLVLPRFGVAFEAALERGYLVSADFAGFSCKAGGIPRLFEVFTRLVFDDTGKLLEKPAPLAIAAIRQLTYSYKKLKELCCEEKQIAAFKRFQEVEQQLAGIHICESDKHDYDCVCRLLWDTLIPSLEVWRTTPKHGPGATADKRTGNQKYVLKQWHDRLENYFPLSSFGFPNEDAIDSTEWNTVHSVSPEDEQPVRVIAVPKTAKAPRIIAIEPTCMQYAQQALARELVRALESDNRLKGHINFTDQSINQRLAMESSLSRSHATIDLSDASDRVLRELVEPMLSSNPDFLGAVMACRTVRAQVGDDIITLTKFASMGSALCFPIESMVFYTLCILGQLRSRNLPLTFANVTLLVKGTYVYGDDIIIPTDTTQTVFDTLQAFGCKVNINKSFYRGKFRESCGCDAYDGVDVTPVYVRQHMPENRKKIPNVLSAVATMNQFYKIGLWRTAQFYRSRIESVIGPLPILAENTQGIGFESFLAKPSFNTVDGERYYISRFSASRWNKSLQCFEIKALVASDVLTPDEIDSWPALMKFFLERSDENQLVKLKLDLKRSSRRGAVTLKYRWYRPY